MGCRRWRLSVPAVAVAAIRITNAARDNKVLLTLSAFTPHGRRVRLMGSRGYLEGDGKVLRWLDFLSGEEQTYDVNREVEDAAGGHGGGDSGLMRAFLSALKTGRDDLIATGPEVSLESHLIAFAAERARREGRVVDLNEMEEE